MFNISSAIESEVTKNISIPEDGFSVRDIHGSFEEFRAMLDELKSLHLMVDQKIGGSNLMPERKKDKDKTKIRAFSDISDDELYPIVCTETQVSDEDNVDNYIDQKIQGGFTINDAIILT